MVDNVAIFAVVSGGTVRIQTGGDIDIDRPFKLSDSTVTSLSGVLTYTVNPGLPEDLTYTMSLNGRQVITRKVETTIRHMDHEVVSGFRAGANTLHIQITGGTGSLAFSDIVLVYEKQA